MSTHEKMARVTDAVVRLGMVAMQLGIVDRAVLKPDGVTPESDSDHTVMLSLVCCAFAHAVTPRLDVGLVAQLALVHDLVEAYAGDTPTLRISEEERQNKRQREAAALDRLQIEFGGMLPWVPETIALYERLDTPEARFVKTMDKLMPKITHILNKGQALKLAGFYRADMQQIFENQEQALTSSYGEDQPEAMALFEELAGLVLAIDLDAR